MCQSYMCQNNIRDIGVLKVKVKEHEKEKTKWGHSEQQTGTESSSHDYIMRFNKIHSQ